MRVYIHIYIQVESPTNVWIPRGRMLTHSATALQKQVAGPITVWYSEHSTANPDSRYKAEALIISGNKFASSAAAPVQPPTVATRPGAMEKKRKGVEVEQRDGEVILCKKNCFASSRRELRITDFDELHRAKLGTKYANRMTCQTCVAKAVALMCEFERTHPKAGK